ncbi:family 43 glycosylhydrolase [Microbacterium sp. AZCO]|uniref:family 43 glycosylhydrolase n=1 Tax=Microbacterium sp. AZCO TaxID=3142976 RepID=UPI0031F36A93
MQKQRSRALLTSLIAVLIAGVALTGAPGAAVAADDPVELVTNGNIEGGTAPWIAQGTTANLSLGYSTRHAGAMSLKVNARTANSDGANQPMTRLIAGESYSTSAWVHFRDAGDSTVTFALTLRDGAGHTVTLAQAPVVKGSTTDTLLFTQIAGTFTAPATGFDLKTARLGIETVGATVVPDIFFVDDLSLIGKRAPNPPKPVGNAAPAKAIGNANPLMDYEYAADPFAMEYDGQVYVYMTSDAYRIGADGKAEYGYETNADGDILDNSYSQIKTITVISSPDMVNWTNHGQIKVAGKNNGFGVSSWASNSWAPSAAHKTINGVEKFFLYYANSAGGIGVLTSNTPVGPWTDPLNGSALVSSSTPGVNNLAGANNVVWLFDPAVLVDDDGTGYLYFGGGVPTGQSDFPKTGRVIKLGADMTSVDGSAALVNAPALFEDSGIHKFNGKYYYSYCTNFTARPNGLVIDGQTRNVGTGNIAYMVSDSPMGPFTYVDQILPNPANFFGVGGNNHHAIFEFKDSWYITYHAQTVFKKFIDDGQFSAPKGYRSTHIDKISIAPDGTISPITMTMAGVDQVSDLDPYTRIEGETIAWDSGLRDPYTPTTGIRTEFLGTTNDQGMKLTNLHGGEWTALSNVAFGEKGAASVSFRAAAKAGGQIQVRLGSPTGQVVGTVDVPAGNGSSYADYSADLTGATGTADVFFTYVGSASEALFDVDYLSFAEASARIEDGVAVTAVGRCVAGKATLGVTVSNTNATAVTTVVKTSYGSKSLTIQPGKSASAAFTTRASGYGPGEATVEVSGVVDGHSATGTVTTSYPAYTCG